jgi:uncharacterized protein YjgD (DUF1641 family)
MSNKDKNNESEVAVQPNAVDSLNGELVSLLASLEDLSNELGPRLKMAAQEFGPALNGIKANLDKEETWLLADRLSANTNALLDLVNLLEATRDLAGELEPRLKLMMAEVSPFITRIKTSVDKDETILLLEKLASNTGTFIEMLSMLEAVRDLIGELGTRKDGIMKDLGPKLNILRMYVDDDEFWGLMSHMFVLKKEFARLFEDLVVEDEEGNITTPLVTTSVGMLREAMVIADSPLVRNMVTATARNLSGTEINDIRPLSIFGAIGCLFNKDVQKALGFIFYVLRQIGMNLRNGR